VSRSTSWVPFKESLPIATNDDPFKIVRANVAANETSAVVVSCFASTPTIVPRWSYTNSVTRAEASPGTAASPARKYWYSGTGNARRWIKAVLTWGPPSKAAFYYSSDNEATYVPMLDADGNYVLTSTYTGADLNASTWGNVP